jgi:hypothetical protein
MSNTRLYDYCIDGDLKAVENEIKLGANDYNRGLYYACSGGNLLIVEIMLKFSAPNYYNLGLHCAYHSGNAPIVKRMIEIGVNTIHDYIDTIHEAIILLELGLAPIYLKNIDGYDKLIVDLNNFKKETKDSIQEYLLDPIIDIINSYSLL